MDTPVTRQPASPAVEWHALAADEALARWQTSSHGLTAGDVTQRAQRYGLNRLRPPRRRSALLRLFLQFHNVLIYVLLGAATTTALLGHWVDTGVILGVVIINAVIGFIQEGKAEQALEAIRGMLSPQAIVRRDGHTATIPAEELVPGDIVVLQAGDKVPADLRLFSVKDLRIDESILTGESVPVEKSVAAVAADAVLGDRTSMAYSGTLTTYGVGTGVVVATGDITEIGRISGLLRDVEILTTPLLNQLAAFGRWLTLVILVLGAATFLFGTLVRDFPAGDMFLAAVGLAVAAIPEGLPAIMTITLAIGVQRMARRNAIIRRLPAVETLGAITVICSDKTGTLTRNEMTVQSVTTATQQFSVTGVGYDPHGAFAIDGDEIAIADHPILAEIARAAMLCNDATVERLDGEWRMNGDPTEGALITLGLKAGLTPALEREEWPRTDVIPFDSQHRFMATLHHDHAGHGLVYVKGAPERILDMCEFQQGASAAEPLDHHYWQQHQESIAARGQRLLALAVKTADSQQRELRFADVERGLTLLGLVGIIDPPRDEAVRAVRQCRDAGIRVKMITGDHALTAAAIGRQMGIGEGRAPLTGRDLDHTDDAELSTVIDNADVFARTSPEHKLRLVMALQAQRHIVAMTGDGVNDAPALRRADVGIAMGKKGTDVTKEAAEMVLADDNFASIISAVEEGRTVYDNLRKAILFMLPTNGGEAFTLIVAIALGYALPITPVQILWVNTVTAITLALALAFEPAEPGVMARPPRAPDTPILSRLLIWRIAFVTLVIVTGTLGLFVWERENGADIETARTVAVNTLTLFQAFYLFSARYIIEPVFSFQGFFGNRYVLIAVVMLIVFQLAFTYAAPWQSLFGSVPLDAGQWLRSVLVASTVLLLVEVEKAALRAHRSRGGAARVRA